MDIFMFRGNVSESWDIEHKSKKYCGDGMHIKIYDLKEKPIVDFVKVFESDEMTYMSLEHRLDLPYSFYSDSENNEGYYFINPKSDKDKLKSIKHFEYAQPLEEILFLFFKFLYLTEMRKKDEERSKNSIEI